MKSTLPLSFLELLLFIFACKKEQVSSTESVFYTQSDTTFDIEGNAYPTIILDGKRWFQTNLRTRMLNDSTPIVHTPDGTAWHTSTSPIYDYPFDDSTSLPEYGLLYSGNTVRTGKLCPTGWHLPDSFEIKEVINFLDSVGIAKNNLKDTTSWNDGSANNRSGLQLYLLAGIAFQDGGFQDLSTYQWVGYWSQNKLSSASGHDGHFTMILNNTEVIIGYRWPWEGWPCRCIED